MREARGGYTVIEVLIVLAITGVLFVSAVALFRGKQGQTQFNQAMYDLESKIQSTVNTVQGGSFPDSGNYSCSISGSRPVLAAVAAGTGTNEECIMLGRAMQVITNPAGSAAYIYTVLGTRTTSTGAEATTFAQTNPEAICNCGSSSIDLTERYNLPGGAQVVSSTVNGQGSSEYDLLGLYNSPQGSGTAGQSSSFISKAYQFIGTPANANLGGEPRSCIRSASCSPPIDFKEWKLCVESSEGSQEAYITINTNPGGITTKITFNNCS